VVVLGLILGATVHLISFGQGLDIERRMARAYDYAKSIGAPTWARPLGEMQPIATLEEIVSVGAGALFLVFLTSAHLNLPALGVPSLAPPIARGNFIVTFAMAVLRPRRIMDEVWGGIDGPDPRAPLVVFLWWPAWVLSLAAVHVGDRLSAAADTLPKALFATRLEIVAEAGFVLTAIALVVIVRLTAARQNAAARSAHPPVPAR
jgi:hypothetical protein